MVERYWWLCPLRKLIMDHGSEFGAHRIHDDGSWSSEFKDHLKKDGIKPILARPAKSTAIYPPTMLTFALLAFF
jgi:hypothetical protein